MFDQRHGCQISCSSRTINRMFGQWLLEVLRIKEVIIFVCSLNHEKEVFCPLLFGFGYKKVQGINSWLLQYSLRALLTPSAVFLSLSYAILTPPFKHIPTGQLAPTLLNKNFSFEIIKIATKYLKRCSSLIRRKMKIKTIWRFSFTPVGNGWIHENNW